MATWHASDIRVTIDDQASSGSVVTVRIVTPAGALTVMGEIEFFERELVLSRVHIQSEDLRANDMGWASLRQLAQAIAEKADGRCCHC